MEIITIFYTYVAIEHPKKIVLWQKKICKELQLTGRIIVAQEGINGTLAGKGHSLEQYKKIMHAHPYFHTVEFKDEPGTSSCFPRLRINIKEEIVHLGLDPKTITARDGGTHLTPEQAHHLMTQKKDLVIFDARNHYESAIGHFENALLPSIQYFRQLPSYIDTHLEQFKDKEILMYCTGGIRCERASAYLKSKNVAKEVYQINGGIINYIKQYKDKGFFRGKNYVFDGRIATPVTNEVLGTCALCPNACDDYTNCLHAACNKHFICCSSCLSAMKNMCSRSCYELVYTNNAPQRPPLQKTLRSQ